MVRDEPKGLARRERHNYMTGSHRAILLTVAAGGLCAGLLVLLLVHRPTERGCPTKPASIPVQFLPPTMGSGPGYSPQLVVPNTPVPVPTVSAGRIVLAESNNNQTVTVPEGTVLQIVLGGASGWEITPVGPSTASPIRATSFATNCEGFLVSTFSVQGAASFKTVASNGEVHYNYEVTVLVSG